MYKGRELHRHTARAAIAGGMVLVSEDRKRYGLFLQHSINFNLSIAALQRCSRHGLINQQQEQQYNQHWFDALNIKAPDMEGACQTLSGGNQQKVVLGKNLINDPSLVLLDEPTRGIDIGAKVEIYEIIKSLKNQGKAIIMVSSEMPELMGMSDRIIVLAEGRISGRFERDAFDQEQLLQAAMHVETAV
jgi:ABC-type sugar transport system ATPase subunit